MGLLLSLPLAPLSIIGSWVSSCLGVSICTCCMNKNVNPLMKTFKSSIATRITYAIIFMLNSIISWISLSNSLTKFVEKLTWGLFKFGNKFCKDEQSCIGFTSVQRINFSLGIFHLILAGLLVGVTSTRNPRAVIQNGYWIMKLFVIFSFIIISYLIPDRFFVIWGNYLSIIFSTIFIGIGLILLVDFAHEWAETCIEKIDEGEIYLDDGDNDGYQYCNFQGSNFWKQLLIGGTLVMYIGVIIMTVLMYIYFAQTGCSMNKAVITINLIFTLLITWLSITPMVQEYNPNAGLAQSSMCCIYCTYLIFSACLSEPDDKLCNPLIRSNGTRTLTIIVGAIFTFGAVAYTTTRAAANSAFSHEMNTLNNQTSTITEAPKSLRREMRYEAIRQAVNEGSLPESALNDGSYFDDNDSDNENDSGEERDYTKYSYVVFHIIFFLATQYIAALLTINVGANDVGSGTFIPVGRTYFNSWLKIVSSWFCYALYSWTLLAPALFPDRF
ncbi:hypothetical protein C6P40_003949 [Pichia californica]|uniref:Membrane protein TMS1 n=1 Tax=Pichia californica TaxID=460514 RepID=A0A9P6WQM6_9ASCO|nr:hypothetical protein C6P42_004657 [[Candida] californica]KAG0690053.1 hypothetical protein C6P40_003949 [[Candida] californica]